MPGALGGGTELAGTRQEDKFCPYEEIPVECFHFSGGMGKRYSVELISNFIKNWTRYIAFLPF